MAGRDSLWLLTHDLATVRAYEWSIKVITRAGLASWSHPGASIASWKTWPFNERRLKGLGRHRSHAGKTGQDGQHQSNGRGPADGPEQPGVQGPENGGP